MPKPPSPTRPRISNSPRRVPSGRVFAPTVTAGAARGGTIVRSSSADCDATSALQHLHRFFQTASHPVERCAEHANLVARTGVKLGELEVTGAHLVRGARHVAYRPHDHAVQHDVQHHENEQEYNGQR